MEKRYGSIEELLTDDGFLAWCTGTDEHEIARWTEWIIASDEHAELARQAYDLLRLIEEVEESEAADEDIARLWADIEARIREEERSGSRAETDPEASP